MEEEWEGAEEEFEEGVGGFATVEEGEGLNERDFWRRGAIMVWCQKFFVY